MPAFRIAAPDFAENSPMETLLTENGPYRLLLAPGAALLKNARDRLRQAAGQGNELVYGDEILLDGQGGRRLLQKPDWSPDTLRSFNYMGGPVAASEALWREAGCREGDGPEVSYGNLLRLTALSKSVLHIGEPLAEGPAGKQADPVGTVAAALRQAGINARVGQGLLPGTAAVRYRIPRGTRVSCVVYGSGDVNGFRRTLESVACRNTYPHVELILADGCPLEERTERYAAALRKNRAAEVLRRFGETNLARLCNLAAEGARGDAVLFLPAGYGLGAHDGLERMLEYALRPYAGAVFGGVRRPRERPRPHERIIRNVSLAAPPVMIRRDRFLSTGGFDETLGRRGFSEALCWRLTYRRLHNVATPYAPFDGPEGGAEQGPPITARNRQRWNDLLFQWGQEVD